MDGSTWFLFFLLPHWCLYYIRGGRLGQQKVYAHFKTLFNPNWVVMQINIENALIAFLELIF